MSSTVIEAFAEVIEPEETSLQVTYTPAVLADNLAALDAEVERKIAPFVGIEINPNDYEQIKAARVIMAELNKIKAPIEDERKRVKRTYEEPLKKFEGRVKDITSKIDDARAVIKAQVDAADEQFKAMRLYTLRNEYVDCVGIMADVIPFEAVLEDVWLNRSTGDGKAISDMLDKAQQALQGYNTLKEKQLVHKDEVVKHYADTLDLIGALQLEDTLNAKDAEMAEFKAAEQAMLTAVEPVTLPEPEPNSAVIVADNPLGEPVFAWSLSLSFEGSREYANRVASALKAVGVTGAVIKNEGIIHD